MTKDEINKLLMESYDQGVKDAQQVVLEELRAFHKLVADKYREPLELALAELYRHATDTESGEKAIAAVEGALNEDK